MVYGFDSLRHDTVIGSNNQDDQIRNFGAAGTHFSKSFMSRGIQKDNLAFISGNMIGADVLRDSSGFIFCNFGFSYHIKKRCFPVIHMPHNCDHRGPLDELFRVIRFYL